MKIISTALMALGLLILSDAPLVSRLMICTGFGPRLAASLNSIRTVPSSWQAVLTGSRHCHHMSTESFALRGRR